jgi:hypothetical protein
MEFNILGILVKDHSSVGGKLQELFLDFGCIIRTRLGLNRDDAGSVIIMDLYGNQDQINLFLKKLGNMREIEYKNVIL